MFFAATGWPDMNRQRRPAVAVRCLVHCTNFQARNGPLFLVQLLPMRMPINTIFYAISNAFDCFAFVCLLLFLFVWTCQQETSLFCTLTFCTVVLVVFWDEECASDEQSCIRSRQQYRQRNNMNIRLAKHSTKQDPSEQKQNKLQPNTTSRPHWRCRRLWTPPTYSPTQQLVRELFYCHCCRDCHSVDGIWFQSLREVSESTLLACSGTHQNDARIHSQGSAKHKHKGFLKHLQEGKY